MPLVVAGDIETTRRYSSSDLPRGAATQRRRMKTFTAIAATNQRRRRTRVGRQLFIRRYLKGQSDLILQLMTGCGRLQGGVGQSSVDAENAGNLSVKLIPFETNIREVKAGETAHAAWSYEFDEKGAPCDGYIVQQVKVFVDESNDSAKWPKPPGENPAYTFYEAWHYKKGEQYQDGRTDSWTDQASWELDRQTCGYYVQKVTIKLFRTNADGKDSATRPGTINWPTGKSYQNAKGTLGTRADNAQSTDKLPQWWNAKPEFNPLSRTFSVIYNCCPGNDYVKAEADPGFPNFNVPSKPAAVECADGHTQCAAISKPALRQGTRVGRRYRMVRRSLVSTQFIGCNRFFWCCSGCF